MASCFNENLDRYKVCFEISENSRKAPVGAWIFISEIELLLRYYLYGPKIRKTNVRRRIKE